MSALSTPSGLDVHPVPHTPMEDLCLDFVNSRFNDHRGTGAVYDRLALAGWWSWLVQRWDLAPCPAPEAHQLPGVRRLRAIARRLLESGVAPAPRDRRALDRILAASPLTWRVSREPGPIDASLEPLAPGRAYAMAAIVLSLVDVLGNDPGRVRKCGNQDCSFLFRDTSRNRSRRWCDPGICGNLVKVRAFRAAHAQ